MTKFCPWLLNHERTSKPPALCEHKLCPFLFPTPSLLLSSSSIPEFSLMSQSICPLYPHLPPLSLYPGWPFHLLMATLDVPTLLTHKSSSSRTQTQPSFMSNTAVLQNVTRQNIMDSSLLSCTSSIQEPIHSGLIDFPPTMALPKHSHFPHFLTLVAVTWHLKYQPAKAPVTITTDWVA